MAVAARRQGLVLRGLSSLGVVIALLSASAALAQGSPSHATTVQLTAHYTDAGDHYTLGGVDPNCPVGQVGMYGTAYFQGSLRAMDTANGCIYYDPQAQAEGTQLNDSPAFAVAGYTEDHLDGWLQGCGKGKVTLRQTDIKIIGFDPITQTIHGKLSWSVEPGSGTGAFRDASGGGTATADFTLPTVTVPPTTPNSGTYVGRITCPNDD